MPEELPFDPPFEVNLGEYGGIHKFYSLDQIEKGINEEERRWSWLPKTLPSGLDVTGIRDRQNNILKEVRGLLQQARSVQNDAQEQARLLKSIKEKLETHYKTRTGLNSNAPQAKLFFTDKWGLRLDDPEVAFFALAYFLNHVPQSYLASPKCVKGMFEAFSFGREVSWTEFKKPFESFMDELRGKLRSSKKLLKKSMFWSPQELIGRSAVSIMKV